MNGTTGRQARRRRIDAMPVAMGILLAAGLLSGCGSDSSRIMLSPSEQPAAASSDAASADSSSSAFSPSPSAETSPGTDSLDPAAMPSAPPARPSLGDHPCVLASAAGTATARKITCHPAKVQTGSGSASAPPSGSPSAGPDSSASATGGAQSWSMERIPGPIRTYEFAPGAQVFVSSRLSGMPGINDNDAARPTWPQFVAYAHKRSADPLQVYIELDANDRILLLWEPHRP